MKPTFKIEVPINDKSTICVSERSFNTITDICRLLNERYALELITVNWKIDIFDANKVLDAILNENPHTKRKP